MAENMIKFLRGNVASLPQTATPGAVYFTKDEGLYLGLDDGSYHRYGDFIIVGAVASLPSAGAHENCMYYCVAENILAKWSGTEWTQINKQKTLAELGGVAKSVYEAKITNLEKADTDNATAISDLETYVGTIPADATATNVVAYVQEKTADIASDATVSALAGRVDDLETKVDVDSVSDSITAAKTAVLGQADYTGTVKGAYEAAAAAQSTADSKTTMAEVEAKDYATKTEAQNYANAKDTAISAAKKAGDDAQADVDALAGKVGTVADGTTVVGMINAMDTAYKAADTDLSDRITAIEDDYLVTADKTALQNQINTLVGEDTGKSARAISAEEVAKVVAGADASFDTLKEIADWISSHKTDATAMNSAILALEAIVDGIGGDGEKTTVVEYVNDAISALKIGEYAKAADLTALAARVTDIENKNISDGANKVEKSTTNGNIKIDGVETVVYTHPAEHAISEIIGLQNALDAKATPADITAEINKLDVEDAAVANQFVTAVSETDGKISVSRAALVAGDIPELAQAKITGLIGALSDINTALGELDTNKADKATTLAGYGITDAYTKTETYTKAEVEAMITWGEF